MAYTVTKDLILPATVTGSWPRPRWFDTSMWAKPLDTCMMDIRFREKFQDALAVVISDEERAGLDILTHGDFHCDEDFAGRSWHHYPLQRWTGFEGDHLQSEETRSPWLRYPPGTLLNEIYTAWRWPRVTGKIEHRPLDYAKIWRIAQSKTRKPVRFGTCCSQVMGLFLDIHTPAYKDNREVVWDMAVAMNKELLALRDAGCRCIQIEEPTLHFMANTFGTKHEKVKFMVECYNREVQGLDDVEIWIHTCWGNPEHAAGHGGHELPRLVRALPERAARRRLDHRDQGSQLQGRRAVRQVQGQAAEEDLHRRGQPPVAAGRSCRGCRRVDPHRARAHRARAADRLERLRVRPPGRATARSRSTRPAPSPRAATSSGGSSDWGRAIFRRRIRGCRSTSCRRRRLSGHGPGTWWKGTALRSLPTRSAGTSRSSHARCSRRPHRCSRVP